MPENLKKEIDELRAQLVEQEHRPFTIFRNYFINRKKWPKGDERRTASLKALLWSIFFSSGTIALTGGAIALLTLSTLVWQNFMIRDEINVMKDQNSLIQSQNQFFQQQILLSEISKEKEVVYGSLDKYPAGRKRASLINLVNALKTTNRDSMINLTELKMSTVDMSNLDLSNIDFTGSDFRGTKLDKSDFRNSNFTAAILLPVHYLDSVSSNLIDIGDLVPTSAIAADFRGVTLNDIKANFVNFSHAKFNTQTDYNFFFDYSIFYGCDTLPFKNDSHVLNTTKKVRWEINEYINKTYSTILKRYDGFSPITYFDAVQILSSFQVYILEETKDSFGPSL